MGNRIQKQRLNMVPHTLWPTVFDLDLSDVKPLRSTRHLFGITMNHAAIEAQRDRAHVAQLRQLPIVGDIADYAKWRTRLKRLLRRPDVVDRENGSLHARVRQALELVDERSRT